MTEGARKADGPRWNQLYETAAAQEGHFTTAQAAEAGYSPQLLAKYLRNGRIVRERRAVYRLVHFPPGDNEDLVVIWLWSGRVGVFSHETALALHRLSDILPSEVHMTVPCTWEARRIQVPPHVVLHHGDIAEDDRAWVGTVQATSARRTILDCAAARVAPDLVRQAINEGVQRGLFTAAMVRPAVEYLEQLESATG